jgi:hypothetical protein
MDNKEAITTQADDNESITGILSDVVLPFIESGMVIPIISNSFRVDEIFRDDKEFDRQSPHMLEFIDEARTVEQQLTMKWAKEIGYPMADDYNLARVAQYRQVEKGDPELAKFEYFRFITDRLVRNAEEWSLQNDDVEDEFKETVKRLKKQTQKLIFSEVAQQLDYPRYKNVFDDPLRLLAKLPLPIYITTSYSNFLERALIAEDKQPRTQICFWDGGKSNINPNHLPDPKYDPTPTTPAVYHLFGLEDYKNTLIMSEDDFMGFMMNAVEHINEQDLYPSPLRGALPESRLLLLGYCLSDWDFRALFRFILRIRKTATVRPSVAIQLKPSLKEKSYEAKSLKYLERYFEDHKFKVVWTGNEDFIYKLFSAWDKDRQGQ